MIRPMPAIAGRTLSKQPKIKTGAIATASRIGDPGSQTKFERWQVVFGAGDGCRQCFLCRPDGRMLLVERRHRPDQAGGQKHDPERESDKYAFGIESERIVDLRVGRREQDQENDVHDQADASDRRTDTEQTAKKQDGRDCNSKSHEVLRLRQDVEARDSSAHRGEHKAHHGCYRKF